MQEGDNCSFDEYKEQNNYMSQVITYYKEIMKEY